MARPEPYRLGGADSRPRIFMRPMLGGWAWSTKRGAGARSRETTCRSLGEGVDAAFVQLATMRVVIIVGDDNAGE